MKQKTLIITSIYANLWGTEFGGRASRYHHYRLSLLNMINMKPNKVICYTSQEEIDDLKKFFYHDNLLSEELIEFKVFDLNDSMYFNIIKGKKNIESMKSFDRCYEIQYNKFFWVKTLSEIHDYDKVYWFDAGLSHSGLFPDCFAYGGSYERNFQFDVFNENFLESLNENSEDTFVLVGKNNTDMYYWSTTIPEKYYENYCRDLHIVGGFFGGKPETYLEVINNFDVTLSNLLMNENGLFMEEQILSCLYYNNPNFFKVYIFDDWYKKEMHNDKTKLFYEIFLTSNDCYKNSTEQILDSPEEILPMELKNIEELEIIKTDTSIVFLSTCLEKQEIKNTKTLLNSILSNTDYDFILLTDYVNQFEDITSERIKIISFSEFFVDKKNISNFPNFHINRNLLTLGKKFGYDVLVYCNNDIFLNGWDENDFEKFIKNDFEISFVKNIDPQIGYLIENYEHYKLIIDNEFGDLYDSSLNSSPNPESYFFIVKNNDKLQSFLDFWDNINQKNAYQYPTYYSGVYLGILSSKSQMKMSSMTNDNFFTKFINYQKNNELYDFFGNKIS